MSKKPTGIINIHGREYQTVAYRVQTFREQHPDWTLHSTVIERTDEVVVMEARILDESGRLIANGHAEEYRRASSINKTSALENAETSAIGRALAALGIGGTEFASANEVERAVSGEKPSIDERVQIVSDEREAAIRTVADACIAAYAADDEWKCYEEAAAITDPEERLRLWAHLKPHSAVRSCIKRMAELERNGTKEPA